MEAQFETMTETRMQRRKRAELAAAERSARHRMALAERGQPTVRDVERAQAEAVSYLASLVTVAPAIIDIAELHKTTVVILVRAGFDRAQSKRVVGARMKPRVDHDDRFNMPSRCLDTLDGMVNPPRTGSWLAKDIAFIRTLSARSPSRLT